MVGRKINKINSFYRWYSPDTNIAIQAAHNGINTENVINDALDAGLSVSCSNFGIIYLGKLSLLIISSIHSLYFDTSVYTPMQKIKSPYFTSFTHLICVE